MSKGPVAGVWLASLLSLHATAALQTPTPIGTASLTHLAFVVSDIDLAAAKWAEVLGIPATRITQFDSSLPDGTTTAFKFGFLNLTNFQVELDQPVDARGFIHEHLQKFGSPSVHHVGFSVTGSVDDARAHLQANGGTWVGGPNTAPRVAFVDLRDRAGATIEVVQAPSPPALRSIAPTRALALGAFPVDHVGFAVRRIESVFDTFSKILGTTPPPISVLTNVQYPPPSVAAWNPASGVRFGTWRQENKVGMEICEPIDGPNPWSDTLDKDKPRSAVVVQHLAFNVGDKLDEIVRQLQEKGGRWIHGAPTSRFAYIDFTPTLGIVIEVMGTRPPTVR